MNRKRLRKESAHVEEVLIEQPKRAAKVARAVEDEVGAVDEKDADEGGDPFKDDAGKAAKNGDDEDDDSGDMNWRDLFERASQDVPLVTAMMERAEKSRVELQVGAIRVPDFERTSEAAGERLSGNLDELKLHLASRKEMMVDPLTVLSAGALCSSGGVSWSARGP